MIKLFRFSAMCLISVAFTTIALAQSTVVYNSSSILEQSGWAEESGTGSSSYFAPGDLTLPQFNPALGTLESVQFSGTLSLFGDVQTTCGGNLFCNSNANVYLEGNINLNDVTTSGGQRINNFGPSLFLAINRSVTCNPLPIGGSCTSGSADSGVFGSLIGGARTFSGTSSVAPFIGTGQILFPQSPRSPASSLTSPLNYQWVLDQTDRVDGFLAHPGVGGVIADTVLCGLGEEFSCGILAAEVAYDVYKDTHGPIVSYCCYGFGAVGISRDVLIVYTYKPASASVPEPSTLALLSVAVIPLAIACTRSRRRATTNAASEPEGLPVTI